MEPPVAARRPVEQVHHGYHRVDEYDWLRDPDDPDVRAHLEAENAYTQHRTAHLADLREQVFTEIRSRVRETDLSVPVRHRGHWYYARTFEGRQYGASCRVPVTDPDDWTPPQPDEECAVDEPALPGEEVLLDLDALAEGCDFFSLGGWSISPDGGRLAYSTDTVGDERYTVRVRDLTTGELLPDEIPGVLGGAVWNGDGTELYYVTVDDSWRPDTVWRHRLGAPVSEDERVLHETDERFFVGVGRTRSDRFLLLGSSSKTTSEWHVLDLVAGEREPWCFAPRTPEVEYALEHAVIGGEDCFLVLHNATGADFELAQVPAEPTAPEAWTPLLPHDPAVRLEEVDAFAGHLLVHQRSGGQTQLRVLPLDETGIADDYLMEFADPVRTVAAGSDPEFTQPHVRFGYTTLATPPAVYDYHVADGTRTLRRSTPVLGGFDPDDYVEHRLHATAPDGEQVPVSLVVRRDCLSNAGDGPIPVVLYGYGAYEISVDPWFSVARLSLLDRGAAFAVAHVRGGGEMGRRWYDDGKLAHKQHTFDDFIACAQTLVDTGWTSPDRLVAEGGSAGGLLMGAVANQAPDLFCGISADVPFVDTLTSMLDSSLPLTVTEYDEWGNPEDDPEAYRTIAAYAPYDNIAERDYPAILAETSLHDTRVLFVEPAKWVARLRHRVPDSRDILLKTEMAAGHGGVSGRYRAWHDRAFSLAWILDRLGLA